MSTAKDNSIDHTLDPREILPHKGRMNYVSEIIHTDTTCLECLCPREGSILPKDSSGWISSCVGMEYLSQAAAAFAGIQDVSEGNSPRAGMLLSFRDFKDFSEGALNPEEKYLVRVELEHNMGDVSLFRGEIFDQNKQQLILKGRFSVRIGLEPQK